jgi:uncharacterized protein (TIGR03086 family)
VTLHEEMAAAAAAEAARVVGGVRADQFTAPTPCADWDVHALLNHTILWTAFSAERRARDEPLPDDLMNRDFAAEPGFAATYAAQIDKAVAAWSDPAAWARDLNVMGSPTPAADIAALLLAEMVLHGWDIARASGQQYSGTDAVVTATAAAVDANAGMFRQYGGFAAPVPLAGPAPALDRVLAASGRDPLWTPGT